MQMMDQIGTGFVKRASFFAESCADRGLSSVCSHENRQSYDTCFLKASSPDMTQKVSKLPA